MLELLAPAGSPEAVTAAVQAGADAVYLGYGSFNARRNAKNFSEEEFAAAVSYCHLRGAKVYLTLNTLVTDRELPPAAQLARRASELGADAVLVQDLGVARMLRQTVPDLPLHASTQMTLHSLDGVKAAADLGMTRVVLARELGREEIAYICRSSPIEIEVFVHGALCMCYSGQCFFSSVVGGRSGNRGLCAQPCRLKYGWDGRARGYPLSLKDLSLAGHLRELEEMGVACAKIEGRMKRPEYVAVVTAIYARAIREGRDPTAEELEQLRLAFSRQGFTDGYFTNRTGPKMFGVREKEEEPRELFQRARELYLKEEPRRAPVKLYAMVRRGEPAQVAAEDAEGRVAAVSGPVPEEAEHVALTREKVEGQISRTGGTPFSCESARAYVEEGLSLPLSALNALRRQALQELADRRLELPRRRQEEFHPGVRYENRRQPPVLTVSVRLAEQVTRELCALKPALLYLPAEEGAAHPEKVELALSMGVPVAAALPRVMFDRERDAVLDQLLRLRELGVTEALAGGWGMLPLARELGFTLRGDYGLGVYNSQTLKELKRLGFASATASFELKLAQIRDISKPVDIEMLVYGRLPLMLTQNCLIRTHTGRCTCENNNRLTDRKGEQFPVVKAFGCRSEILNSKKLFLADKAAEWKKIGLWAGRLMFTTENARECVQVLERYLGRGTYEPNDYTRGLYYRDVE